MDTVPRFALLPTIHDLFDLLLGGVVEIAVDNRHEIFEVFGEGLSGGNPDGALLVGLQEVLEILVELLLVG